MKIKTSYSRLYIHKEPGSVAKINACIPLVKSPRNINGIGTIKGTSDTKLGLF